MAEGNSGWSWGWRGAALPWLLIIAGICLIVGV